MNILLINGSPRGERSNTLRLTRAFLKGLTAVWGGETRVEEVEVATEDIRPCKGCFGCWTTTPGRCVIRDGMDDILPKFLWADLVLWSLPLYFYGMPSQVKALLDRTLPLYLPQMIERTDGGSGHPNRYDHQPKVVLLSTCGFHSRQNNYEALLRQFSIYTGGEFTPILCAEGELFSWPELRSRTDGYLSQVEGAGREYAAAGALSPETQAGLETLLYPPEVFVKLADASWDIREPVEAGGVEEEHAPDDPARQALAFSRQMAALYQPDAFSGKEQVLELCYTDCDCTLQLVLGREDCQVRTGGFTPYTTRVETPLTIWQAIARGEVSGEEAMARGDYRTLGELRLLMNWNRYFGGEQEEPAAKEEGRRPATMTLLLLPWMLLWILLPIQPLWAGILTIGAGAAIPLAGLWFTLTPYDRLTAFLTPLLGIWAVLGGGEPLLLASYLLFGLLWLLSCRTAVPLTAHYSKKGYGGERALKNPIFMRCNEILTLCWGVLYLLMPLWSMALLAGPLGAYTGLLNSGLAAVLGGFTVWFERWYPSKRARGRG